MKAQFQGSLNSDAFVQIFNPGSPACSGGCPLFWTYATTNDCISPFTSQNPSCFNNADLNPISGSVTPNVQDFNCSIDKGSATTIRTNVGTLDNATACTPTQGIPSATVYVTLEIDCVDNTVLIPPLKYTSHSYAITASQTHHIATMFVDDNCQPSFFTGGM